MVNIDVAFVKPSVSSSSTSREPRHIRTRSARRAASAMSGDDAKHSSSANGHDYINPIHTPRARKPVNPQLSRALNNELNLKLPATHSGTATPSGISSERATPAPPDDAPPSVKATSAARKHNRRRTKERIFPTVEYHDRVSYFDPKSSYGNFRGKSRRVEQHVCRSFERDCNNELGQTDSSSHSSGKRQQQHQTAIQSRHLTCEQDSSSSSGLDWRSWSLPPCYAI